MDLRAYLRHLDYVLLAAAGGLLVFGVTMIYFATRHDTLTTPFYYARNQIVFAAVGVAALFALSLVDYEHYRRWQWPLYGFVLLSIAAVFALGPVTRGSRRWISLSFVSFQPSELALVIVTVTLAAFLADRLPAIGRRRMTLFALLYVTAFRALYEGVSGALLRAAGYRRRAVLVGTGRHIDAVASALSSGPHPSVEVVGLP